jgi:hypothetical protein
MKAMRRNAAGWNSRATADLVFGDCGESRPRLPGDRRGANGRRRSPIRVNVDIACVWWAFNTAESWACDGSADIARQVLRSCARVRR